MRYFIFAFFLIASSRSIAQSTYSLEVLGAWQALNDQAVPGDGGTRFSLADFGQGPFPLFRLNLGHRWNDRHEIRGLYAPLSLRLDGRFSETTQFAGKSFAADVETQALYRFNSYRLTYIYHFDRQGEWDFGAGFTAKVRDAEVRITQGETSARKENVGFVPLFHLQGRRTLSSDRAFRFDFDGLAAPQGRAFDVGLFLEKDLSDPELTLFMGYRMLEGGADNKEVYNFAWLHQAVVGLRGNF